MVLGLSLNAQVESTLMRYIYRHQKRTGEILALVKIWKTQQGNFKVSIRKEDGYIFDMRYDNKEHRWRKLNKLGQW